MEDLLRVKDIMVIFKDKNLDKVTLKNTKNIIILKRKQQELMIDKLIRKIVKFFN